MHTSNPMPVVVGGWLRHEAGTQCWGPPLPWASAGQFCTVFSSPSLLFLPFSNPFWPPPKVKGWLRVSPERSQ